jgi:carboxylesterase type B
MPVPPFGEETEDCLYMDIYVPSKGLRHPERPLPVLVYIFGGGFIMGSKNIYQPLLAWYDGTGMITQSDNGIIFVVFNYRLGAFGFLAGTSMEDGGLPNAGLWDQRAVFEWVQTYAHLLGGDPGKVTAMGLSAGASSIMHHLVAEGGTLDPLFQRAILLSPSAPALWDRAGASETTFQTFARLAGCEGQGVDCLRARGTEDLIRANKVLVDMGTPGTLGLGATPDGSFIRQLPALELASGNFWPMDSLVMSHTEYEAVMFVDGSVRTNAEFDAFVRASFSNYTASPPVQAVFNEFYPPLPEGGDGREDGGKYETQTDRVEDFMRDSVLSCSINHLNSAYGKKSKLWNMQYSVFPGWHGMDLATIFNSRKYAFSPVWHEYLTQYVLAEGCDLLVGVSVALKSYIVSYVLAGDPNTHRAVANTPAAIHWNQARPVGNEIWNVLNVDTFLVTEIVDDKVPRNACQFWEGFYAAAVAEGGYVPPGAEVEQDMVQLTGNVSRRY